MLPTHIFYDNACHLLRHLQAQKDTFFTLVRLVVDVFHARGHNDHFCDTHTSPALFPELRSNGGWVFNSSVAEQTNVWFGAFQAITREMSEPRSAHIHYYFGITYLSPRYNFFLDEMISIHNEQLVAKLERKGKQPFSQSLSALKDEWVKAHPAEAVI